MEDLPGSLPGGAQSGALPGEMLRLRRLEHVGTGSKRCGPENMKPTPAVTKGCMEVRSAHYPLTYIGTTTRPLCDSWCRSFHIVSLEAECPSIALGGFKKYKFRGGGTAACASEVRGFTAPFELTPKPRNASPPKLSPPRRLFPGVVKQLHATGDRLTGHRPSGRAALGAGFRRLGACGG